MLVISMSIRPEFSALGSDFASFDEAIKFVVPMTCVMSKNCRKYILWRDYFIHRLTFRITS